MECFTFYIGDDKFFKQKNPVLPIHLNRIISSMLFSHIEWIQVYLMFSIIFFSYLLYVKWIRNEKNQLVPISNKFFFCISTLTHKLLCVLLVQSTSLTFEFNFMYSKHFLRLIGKDLRIEYLNRTFFFVFAC